MVLAATSVSAQTSLSVAMRRAGRVVGTHETIPATANGLVVGTSTSVKGRLGAWASFTVWPEAIGQTYAFGGRWSGSVGLGVITIRSSGLAYAVPQAGVAYTLR